MFISALKFMIVPLLLTLCFVCKVSNASNACDDGDTSTRAYGAKLVLEGKVLNKTRLSPAKIFGKNRYNVTVHVIKILKRDKSFKIKQLSEIVIGIFGPVNDSQCIREARINYTYLFFLRIGELHNTGIYNISASPVLSDESAKKDVQKVICHKCAKAPVAKLSSKKVTVREGKRLRLACHVKVGMPRPRITWTRNDEPLTTSSLQHHIHIKATRKGSELVVAASTRGDAGLYQCQATNVIGVSHADAVVTVAKGSMSQAPEHSVPCENQTLCLNGGTCYLLPSLNAQFCACRASYQGWRCEDKNPYYGIETDEVREASTTFQSYIPFIIIGVILAIVAVICLIALLLSKLLQHKECRPKHNAKHLPLVNVNGGNFHHFDQLLTPESPQLPNPMFRKLVADVGLQTDESLLPRNHFGTHSSPENNERLGWKITTSTPHNNSAMNGFIYPHSTSSQLPKTSQQVYKASSDAGVQKSSSFRTRLPAQSTTPDTMRRYRVSPQAPNVALLCSHATGMIAKSSSRSASETDLQLTPSSPMMQYDMSSSPSRSLLFNQQQESHYPSSYCDNEDFLENVQFIDDTERDVEPEVVIPVTDYSPYTAESAVEDPRLFPVRLLYNGGLPFYNNYQTENNNISKPLGCIENDSGPETTL